MAHTECLLDILQSLLANITSCGDQCANGPVVLLLERLRNLVDVLGLGNGLEVVLEDFCEVVCNLFSACASRLSKS